MAERVRVDLGSRGYDIAVGERLLVKAGEHILPHLRGKNVIIVSDEHVARLYLHRLGNSLEEQRIGYRSIILKAGESAKSLTSFPDVMERLLEQKPDRHTVLIALGGGVVGDITGFAASVLLRGVGFIQIPTTLLAQVDSAVGGKTGLNAAAGKNLVGSFHQPLLVLSDISTLTTLPKRELVAGYAEVLKYALINDPAFFAWLEEHAASMLDIAPALPLPTDALTHAIIKSCQAKAAIVAEDEKESGVRALLNFGHTFGHALEAETGFSHTLLHGEAVAIGMMMAMTLSVRMGLCPQQDLDRVTNHYQAAGLPLSPRYVQQDWNIDALMEHFTRDKKAKNGVPAFVLTRGIGKAFITQAVEKPALREVLAQLCSSV